MPVHNSIILSIMATFQLTIVFSLAVTVFSKKLHLKGDLETKNKDTDGFKKLFNDEELLATNERFARHIETITESVLDHIINELKQQYLNSNHNSNSPMRRLILNLNKEMKRNEHKKMVKERQKKKSATSKSKTGKRHKKTTPEKPLMKLQ